MRYYYYLLNNSGTKEQYYIGLDGQDQNISITKIKNAIAKKAVKTLSNLMGIKDSENIKQLEKAIKSSVYDTATLLEGYNNIEVTGNFNKTESKKVIFKSLIKDTTTQEIQYKEIEGEKVNSKVYPNLDLYLTPYAYGKGYNIIFEGLQIAYTRTKNIKDIEESLQNINMSETKLINKVNESLVQLGVKEQNINVESIDTVEAVKEDNKTIKTMEQIDDIKTSKASTTNIKNNNINVVRDSIKLSKIDINNNIYKPYSNNETGSFCNTG